VFYIFKRNVNSIVSGVLYQCFYQLPLCHLVSDKTPTTVFLLIRLTTLQSGVVCTSVRNTVNLSPRAETIRPLLTRSEPRNGPRNVTEGPWPPSHSKALLSNRLKSSPLCKMCAAEGASSFPTPCLFSWGRNAADLGTPHAPSPLPTSIIA